MTRRRNLLLGAGVAAAFATLGGWVAWSRLAPNAGDPAAVELLFTRTLQGADGKPVELSAFRGRTLVLNFWATWCTPCVEEMPELQTLHDEITGRGGAVVGIGIDTPSAIRAFVARHGFSYPLLMGGVEGTELARQLGNPTGALPFTVVIDAKGRVIERKLGRIRLDTLRKQVLSALGS